MEDDQPLETEVDLRNGQNPPLETEIDLRGGARMFFGRLGSQPKMFAVLRLIISRGLKSRSWTIPVVCRMCLWVRGRCQSSKLITRIRLPALAIPLPIPLLPITGLIQ